jgi:pimeloyl-ACP methyl ester carboxylesterase
VSWRVVGAGPVDVVWLHGMYLDASMWQPAAEALSDECRSILVDLRGHGAPDDDADDDGEAGWSFADWVKDVQRVLVESGARRPLLVGHSLGGWVATALALAGAPVRGVVVVNHTVWLAPSLRPTFESLLPVFREGGIPGDVATSFLGMWYAEAHRAGAPDAMQREMARLTSLAPERVARVCEAALTGPDLRAALRGAPCPIQFLLGDADALAPLEDLAGHCDPAAVSVVPGWAHLPLDLGPVVACVRSASGARDR